MNYYSNIKLSYITNEDIIVCGVDERQMQSTYLLINGVLYYTVMITNGMKSYHNNSIKHMENFIKNYPNEYYSLYTMDYVKAHFGSRGTRILNKMNQIMKVVERDKKLDEILFLG